MFVCLFVLFERRRPFWAAIELHTTEILESGDLFSPPLLLLVFLSLVFSRQTRRNFFFYFFISLLYFIWGDEGGGCWCCCSCQCDIVSVLVTICFLDNWTKTSRIRLLHSQNRPKQKETSEALFFLLLGELAFHICFSFLFFFNLLVCQIHLFTTKLADLYQMIWLAFQFWIVKKNYYALLSSET